MSAEPVGGQAFPAGWYGKIPAAGDFMARRLPGVFCQAWDQWLQGVLNGARNRLGGRWQEHFLSMPVWRFVLARGIATPSGWAGVMAPSVDAVGRCFPLAIASALLADTLDPAATLFAARTWFAEIEEIALSAITPAGDAAAIDAALAGRPFRGEWLRSAGAQQALATQQAGPEPLHCLALGSGGVAQARAVWLAEASDIFGRTLLLSDGLLPAENFCALMDGEWARHGWVRRDAQRVS